MVGRWRDKTVAAQAAELRDDRTHESKTLSWNRADELLVGTTVTDRLARGVNAAGQRRLCDNSPLPDPIDQIVLADDPIAIFEQVHQQIEYLGLDGDSFAAKAQFPPIGIKYMIGKEKLHTELCTW
jgi:hypothetical protein